MAKHMRMMSCGRMWLGVWLAALLAVVSMLGLPVAAHAETASGEGTIEVTVRVAGVDDPAAETPVAEAWAPESQQTCAAKAVAWDALKAALDEAGCTYDAQDSEYGVFVQSITSPTGVTLENTSSEPYSYWAFLVNGEMVSEGVSAYALKDGDTVELIYYPGGEAPAHEAMPISGEDPQEPAGEGADGTSPEDGTVSHVANVPLIMGGAAVVAVLAAAVFALVRARSRR